MTGNYYCKHCFRKVWIVLAKL